MSKIGHRAKENGGTAVFGPDGSLLAQIVLPIFTLFYKSSKEYNYRNIASFFRGEAGEVRYHNSLVGIVKGDDGIPLALCEVFSGESATGEEDKLNNVHGVSPPYTFLRRVLTQCFVCDANAIEDRRSV